MLAVLPVALDDWEPPSLAWHEEQIAARCLQCEPWPEDVERHLAHMEPTGWAVPGVTGLDRAEPEALPSVSPEIAALLLAFEQVRASSIAKPDAQALVDAEALLELEQRLRVHSVGRIADAGRRGLHELVGFRNLRTWLRSRRPDGDSSDATLAAQLADYPLLQAGVMAGDVPLAGARRVVKAMARCWRKLDRPDRRIDEQPGDEVLQAVVGNAIAMICRYLNGLQDDDPRLHALITRGGQIFEDQASQRTQVEATLTMLAEHIPPRSLAPHIEELVLSLLPSELDDAAADGHANRGLVLKRKTDGSGWHLTGDLDLECGERLFAALRAEATRDPDNIHDTIAWQAQHDREAADCPFTGAPSAIPDPSVGAGEDGPLWFQLTDQLQPRSKPRRLHDALNRLLGRYLEQGLGGTVNKLPVQVGVVITEPSLAGRPGAPPPRADSGAMIPRAMVRRWWCDASVTAFVMSLGGRAVRAVHAQRTLTPLERRALQIETGARCAGQGCCPDEPDPLHTLIPHHVVMFSKGGRTCLDESLPLCEAAHQDLHEGKRTLLLRDGRYVNENGFTTAPPWPDDQPPF